MFNGGSFLEKFVSCGCGNGHFKYPRGVCIGASGMVYVIMMLVIITFRYSMLHDGTFSHSTDGSRSQEGVFKHTWFVALGHNGDLHVTGKSSNSVTIFSSE